MNFPRWIRSNVTISGLSDANEEELCHSIAHNLERRGATNIEFHDGAVHFRAERAILSWNPLSLCSTGMFQVEKSNDGVRTEYEIDRANPETLIFFAALFVPMLVAIFVIALIADGVFGLSAIALWFGVSFSLAYVIQFLQLKSLFRKSVLPDDDP